MAALRDSPHDSLSVQIMAAITDAAAISKAMGRK